MNTDHEPKDAKLRLLGRSSRKTTGGLILVAVASALSLPATVAASPAIVVASTTIAPEAEAHDTSGYLYGTVTTTKGKAFTGILRWDGEEAFWDDLFNASKADLPHLEEYGQSKKPREFEIFGRKISIGWGGFDSGRQFVVRFGDIERIVIEDKSRAQLVMRDGTHVAVDGGSNDIGATISVQDTSLGEVKLPWKGISKIEFLSTPAGTPVSGYRLHGKVVTDDGTFAGAIQWDKQEALSFDELDGEEDNVEMSIQMGQIRSIESLGRRSCRVTLKDGRRHDLSGTNDVNDSNRGIVVEDPRFGRVDIPWTSFRKLELVDASGSGRGRGDYAPGKPLKGRVKTTAGKELRGTIVFDLDEAYSWEMLDGNHRDIAYAIPFGLVSSIAPRGDDAAKVRLRSGAELELSNTQDVTDSNAGILVLQAEGKGVLVPWTELEILELDG